MIPTELLRMLHELGNNGWSGRLTLSFKDGQVLEYEQATKTRLARGDRPEPASTNAGGSHAGTGRTHH